MGGWFSSFFKLQNFLYRPKQLSIGTVVGDPNRSDPFTLLSAAAEIAALHRMENMARSEPGTSQMNTSQSSTGLVDADLEEALTHFTREEREQSSDSDSESSSHGSLHLASSARQRNILDGQSKLPFIGRMIVGDQKAFRELREEIQCSCYGWNSSSTNIVRMCSRREILKPLGGSSMCLGMKTAVINQFLPNCRRLVDKLKSKSFCCQFVKGGDQLIVASQDERIRFFQQCGPRDRYLLKNAVHVPVTSWSILDVAMNRTGDALCYGTWRDSIFYARLFEPTSDNPTGILWTELDIPNQDATMAVFSLRFSRDGHEVLCGGSDRSLHIFNLETMSRVVTINDAHGDDVNAVCYGDTDSHLLYSGGDDGLVKVFDRRALRELDYQPVGVFAGHRDGITYIDARGDDRHLISNSKDQTIKLWDLRRFSSHKTVQKTIKCVRQQSWDYRWQPAPSTEKSPLEGDTSVLTFRGHSVLHTLVRAKFSPRRTGRRYIYSGCARGEVVIYDILSSSPSGMSAFDASLNPVICRMPGHVGVVRDVDWHPTNNEIVTSAWDGVTSIWKWDERYDYVRSCEKNRSNAEESCDESYKPVMKRRKGAKRKKYSRTWDSERAREEQSSSSHLLELLYSF
ncbi:hypothetical protein KIN20_002395 [Parelaphostrongylus tenuis]|uniref:DDB1- and CUL4-associated factor 11 n=1 Tax=Parelaphostrongylus tenuis TaxID=148309 RepID=A0AAD5MGK0_PARTN|nr:hypothetical protein KIN20_002395 [Parelaphostrongylus tenuis]